MVRGSGVFDSPSVTVGKLGSATNAPWYPASAITRGTKTPPGATASSRPVNRSVQLLPPSVDSISRVPTVVRPPITSRFWVTESITSGNRSYPDEDAVGNEFESPPVNPAVPPSGLSWTQVTPPSDDRRSRPSRTAKMVSGLNGS